jgi:hypothetical protein
MCFHLSRNWKQPVLPPPKTLHGAITHKFQTGIFYCNFQKCDKEVNKFLLTILLNNFGEGTLLYITIVTVFDFVMWFVYQMVSVSTPV